MYLYSFAYRASTNVWENSLLFFRWAKARGAQAEAGVMEMRRGDAAKDWGSEFRVGEGDLWGWGGGSDAHADVNHSKKDDVLCLHRGWKGQLQVKWMRGHPEMRQDRARVYVICVESVAQMYQAVRILFVVTGAKLPLFTSYRMVVLSRPRRLSWLKFLKLFDIKCDMCE